MAGILSLGLATMAQVKSGVEKLENTFWTKVDYIGAFGTEDWTAGWSNFNPQTTVYPATTSTKGNGNITVATGEHLTTNTTWAKGVYKLSGWVIVDSNVTLTIAAGTVVRGVTNAAIMVKRGGKLVAEGTASEPIVFTSFNDAGSRTDYDWGGIIICGNAPNNNGIKAQYEGIADLYYGGVNGGDAADNSGKLKYVRIEFGCLDFGNAKEVNALTLCAVGNGTTIDYVQTSYSGDDAYEFFGGTVSAKHLIAFKTEDDDFDTDNGWSGMVQFAVALRDPQIADSDAGRTFESDNDATGSDATPKTSGTFSNVTSIGPKQDDSWTQANNWQAKLEAAMYLRRNTELKIWNSLFVGTAKGLIIDGTKCVQNAKDDKLQVKFTTLCSVASPLSCDTASVNKTWTPADVKTWFEGNHGTILTGSIWDCELNNPFSLTNPKFTVDPLYPTQAYPRNKSCWTDSYITTDANLVEHARINIQNPVGSTIVCEEELEIFNSLGVLVAKGNGTIDVSSLAPGIYVAKSKNLSTVVIKSLK